MTRAAGGALLWLAALLLCAPAFAHLMPGNQGTVRIDREGVFAVVSLPAAAFANFDTDGNGRMSLAELNARRDELLRQGASLLEFRADGRTGRVLLQDLLIPHLHDPSGPADTDYVIAMQRVVWDGVPGALSLRTGIFGAAGAQPLALQASREGEAEAVVLTPAYPEHRFFAGPVASFLRYVGMGAEHILAGADHLLFLLTVLVVGASWRYWIAVVTSFTLAHSITLTLSVLGWARVPAEVAEPLIAASIVLMAIVNLREREVRLLRRSAIVFACGLVHGMGFARALQELGGSGSRWLQLAGFNLGVEVGQLMFAGLALGVVALLQRSQAVTQPMLARGISWGAAGLGSALLVHLLAA